MNKLWVRTEASARVGLGHFMRCFAIAEAARADGFEVVFLLNDAPQGVLDRLTSIGAQWRRCHQVIGAAADADDLVAQVPSGEVLLLDSYAIDSPYLDRLHNKYRLVVMDDLAQVRPLQAHLVINAVPDANTLPYDAIAPETVKCLGPSYAPVRREFTRAYPPPHRPHIVVVFGGSDPKGFTATCAKALLDTGHTADIRLIVGPANDRIDDLRQLSAAHPRLKVYSSPDSVAEVLAGAELVITAGGGSVAEVAAMQLCALVLVTFDNQAAWLRAAPFPVLDARKGWPDDFAAQVGSLMRDARQRHNIATRAHHMIDGKGARRIVQAMRAL